MKKKKLNNLDSKTMNCEFELPEDLIHRIQSSLTGKEAAQTITLSKSWLSAWLTRPNLDFDESNYYPETFDKEEKRRNGDEFLALVKKTIQRYEDSNLKIESFRLKFYRNHSHFETLIVKALKLCSSLLRLEINNYGHPHLFVIPREVFESENLFGLSVNGCAISLGMDHNVRCYNLVSLSLSSVDIENSDVISNIISSCPLIRNLSLSNVFGPVPINLPKLHDMKCLVLAYVNFDFTLFFRDMSSNFPLLKDLNIRNVEESMWVEVEECTGTNQKLESLSLDSMDIETHMLSRLVLSCPLIKNVSLSNIFENQINLPKLHNLKSLTLIRVNLDSLFFDDLSSKFPALEFLTLDRVYHSDEEEKEVEEEMRISSRSLECLNLTPEKTIRLFKFDVPSIKKIAIEACFIPSVSFESTSQEWEESHVYISINEDINPCSNSWFLALNELLTALSPSKINISIVGSCDKCFDYEVRDIQGLRPQLRVENLTVDIQCPRLITQYQYLKPSTLDPGRYIDHFLFKRLEQAVNGEFSSPGSFMYGLHDLKDVFVQFLDAGDVSVGPWKPLAEALEINKDHLYYFYKFFKTKRKILFQLVWKS